MCRPYFEITYITSATETEITRSYKGILDFLGELGGLVDMFHIAFAFIYAFYHVRVSKNELVLKVYGLKGKAKSCSCKKKLKIPQSLESAKLVTSAGVNRDICYSHEDGHLIISRKEMASARDRIASSLDVIKIVKEIETLKFIVASIFKQQDRDIIPTLCWKASESQVGLEQTFSTGTVSLITTKNSNTDQSTLVQNLKFLDNGEQSDPGKELQLPTLAFPKTSHDGGDHLKSERLGEPRVTNSSTLVVNWMANFRRLALALLPIDNPSQPMALAHMRELSHVDVKKKVGMSIRKVVHLTDKKSKAKEIGVEMQL